MRSAGFVLTGGKSSRMGRNKALLPLDGVALAARVAREVEAAAGTVTLLGEPDAYAHLGWPVWRDLIPDRGPMGGLLTALSATEADWNLLAACDMPAIGRDDFEALLDEASACDGDCVVPRSAARGVHPLCAVYHRRTLPAVRRAVEENRLKMKDLLLSIRTVFTDRLPAARLMNLNTPEDWLDWRHAAL